jgi:hypothetical protein
MIKNIMNIVIIFISSIDQTRKDEIDLCSPDEREGLGLDLNEV